MENVVLCKRLKITHKSGDVLYPVMMKNRGTGVIAFRVSKSGNTKEDSLEITDENQMIDLVVNSQFRVRARTVLPSSQGGRSGLYALDQRSVRDWFIDQSAPPFSPDLIE